MFVDLCICHEVHVSHIVISVLSRVVYGHLQTAMLVKRLCIKFCSYLTLMVKLFVVLVAALIRSWSCALMELIKLLSCIVDVVKLFCV